MIKDIKRKLLCSTAIYITSNYIDIVKGAYTLKGPQVHSIQRFPCTKNLSKIKASERKEETDKMLARAFDEEEMPYRVAVNIDNQDFILRRFSMLNVPDNEIDDALGFEVQKYIPYALDKLSYNYEKKPKNKEEIDIVFNACEKKVLNDIIKYFYDKDITPSVIKPGPSLVTEGIRKQKKIKDGLCLSMHYQPPNKVVLTGIFQQSACFFREVETILGEDEFSTTEFVYPPLKDVWGLIEKDVVRVIDYLKKEFNQDIEKVFISGFAEDATEKKIFEDFGLEFERITFEKYKDAADGHGDRFLPVLSLFEQTFSPVKMNLAPEMLLFKDYWNFKPVVQIASALFSVILVAHLVLSFMIGDLRKQERKLSDTFNRYHILSVKASEEELESYKKTLTVKTDFLNKIIGKKVFISIVLSHLGSVLGFNSWIDKVVFDNQIRASKKMDLRLKGAVYGSSEEGLAEVNKIVDNIKNNPQIMEFFTTTNIKTAKSKKFFDEEITAFEIVLK